LKQKLSYNEMMSALFLNDEEALEELLLEGIGRDLFRGELSQSQQCFYVSYSRARDCREGDQAQLLERLQEMYA